MTSEALVKYQTEIQQGLVAQAGAVQIITDVDYQAVAVIARLIQTVLAELEEERVKITKPMNEALRNTNSLFKTVKEQYELAERILKDKLSTHLEAAKELESEALQATESHDALAVVALAAPVAQGVQQRTYYDVEVVDPDLVPDTFWVVDEKAIRAYVKTTRGKNPIPGVRITPRKDVAVSKG